MIGSPMPCDRCINLCLDIAIGTSSDFDVRDQVKNVRDGLAGRGFDVGLDLEPRCACNGGIARREPGIEEDVEIFLPLSVFWIRRWDGNGEQPGVVSRKMCKEGPTRRRGGYESTEVGLPFGNCHGS